MITTLLTQLNDFFIGLGYGGIFLACLGLFPAEPLIALYAATKPDQILMISLSAALGEMVGAYPTYLFGKIFKEEKILDILRKKRWLINVSEESFLKSKKKIKKKGFFFLLLSRFVPWLRVATSVAAGFLRFDILKFSISVFIGTFAYALFFAIVGIKIGDNWEIIQRLTGYFNNIGILLFVFLIFLYIFKVYKKK